MKPLQLLRAGVILTAAGLPNAWAGPHAHIGVYIGAPWAPWYYPPPYYYYREPIVVQAPRPPVYVEQGGGLPGTPPPAAQPANYWYYCTASQGYYPYVKDCPGGWQTVAPQPPPPAPSR